MYHPWEDFNYFIMKLSLHVGISKVGEDFEDICRIEHVEANDKVFRCEIRNKPQKIGEMIRTSIVCFQCSLDV